MLVRVSTYKADRLKVLGYVRVEEESKTTCSHNGGKTLLLDLIDLKDGSSSGNIVSKAKCIENIRDIAVQFFFHSGDVTKPQYICINSS